MTETMRHLLLVLLLLTGCQSVEHIPAETEAYGIDVTPYTEQDFLFTPFEYNGDYEAIGFVTVTVWPEANKVQADPKSATKSWQQEPVSTQEGLQAAFEQARELGADALADFQLRPVTRRVEGAELDGVEVSGFAIRRE